MSLWQDLRHGTRVFVRNPALTAIAVTSIAFGTGANVAIFSVADALLLKPMPVLRPSELLTVGSMEKQGTVPRNKASYRDYLDIRERATTFDGIVAFDYESVGITTRAADPPRIRLANFVSDNFFRVLGIEPSLGRSFRPDEVAVRDARAVVVISDAFWRAEFNADEHVVGKTLRISGRDFQVIGVAPASFTGLHPYIRDSIYLPVTWLPTLPELYDIGPRRDLLDARDARVLTLKGRLRSGTTMAEAQAEMTQIGGDLERAYPTTNTSHALIVQTELQYRFEQRPLDTALVLILTILSVAVLCVACANVAGLLASRAPIRAREMALRLAVGASRARLVRQLVTESLGIAIGGAVAGLAVAQAGIALLRQIQFPTDLVSVPSLQLNERTLVFSLIVAAASAFLVGLGPALQTTRVDLVSQLKSGDRSAASRQRLTGRSVLVAIQVACSLVLLTVSVFAVQVFHRELNAGPGFRVTRMAQANVSPGQASYTQDDSTRFFSRLLEGARALPGARSASLAAGMPMFSYQFAPVLLEGQQLLPGQSGSMVWANSVDDRFFETMDIGLIRGRAFAATDAADAPAVAIVNDTLARHFWPDADPIGKRLQVLDQARLVDIVGVVKTTKLGFPGELPQEGIYFPYLQRPRAQMVLIVQSDADSASLLQPMRDLIHGMDPDVPVSDVQTVEQFIDRKVTSFGDVMVRLIGAMGLMGMLLTMLGLYGLVSYAVSRRTREIGIRIAIGATYARILRMVLHEGLTPAYFGVALGLALSAVTSQWLLTLVPFSHHVDGVTYSLVVPLIVATTVLAALIPARRAARVNPVSALRYE